MENLIGQQLSVGDAVKYVTRGRPSQIRKGILTRFILAHKRVYDNASRSLVVVEYWKPVVYSWNRRKPGGFGRVLADCELVFPINETFDEIKAEMIDKYR